jgi:NADPH2:quinone reductase
MKAIAIRQHGGVGELQYEDFPLPQLVGGDVLIRTSFSGVNFIDTYHRSGLYPLALPAILGMEGAGEVVEAHPSVSDVRVGDRVAWAAAPHSYAEFVRVPSSALVVIPPAVSTEQAAAAMLQGLTAHYLIHSTHHAQRGETALVHAGAGGVGSLLVQWLAAKGVRVISTVSTPEKAEYVASLGASETINYSTQDVSESVRQLTDGIGVDVVYDGVGAATFEASLKSLKPRGMLALFGAASGPVPAFDLQRLNGLGSLFVTRPTLAHHISDPHEFQQRSAQLFDAMQDGSLKVNVSAKYPLHQAAEAHLALEGRSTTGKIVLSAVGDG